MPTPPTALHTLSLHDALPIWSQPQDLSRKAGRQIHLPLASEKQPARETGKLPFLDVFSVAIEELDSAILTVGHIDRSLPIDHDRVRDVELSRSGPLAAPALEKRPWAIELQDTRLCRAVPFG